MRIFLNGKPHELADQSTVAALIDELQLAGKRLAVELNGEILPRSEYSDMQLSQNDQLEIVHAIGGGQTQDI